MPKSRLLRGLLALSAGLASGLLGRSEARGQADPGPPVVRIAYFVPTDRKPEPDRVARLDRVMTEVQRFFRRGMEQNGHAPLTFGLDRTADGKLRVHEVHGKEPMRAYGRQAAGKVRDEVKVALAREQIDADRETIVIFQLLLDWDGDRAIEVGPYVGGGDAHGGTAWLFDDARLDPDLLASKKPGGFYQHPCSLGEFNTHYIGGLAHELGHALGLPHERERKSETARRGSSLMGSGNHTYGRELRGEGPGAFLTGAAALPLSVHPLFNGRRQPRADLTCQITELDATPEPGKFQLAGRLEGGPNAMGLVAYSDPQSIPGDYDALGWPCRVEADGRFRLTIEDLRPGTYDLRLRPVGPTGETKTFSFLFEVDGTGLPLVEPLLEGPWILRASQAYRARDRARLAEVVAAAKRALPRATMLQKKLAQYQKLASPTPLRPLARVPASTKSIGLADVPLDSATTGWGPALRNQVASGEGEGSLLEVGGAVFASGFYAHAPARHAVRLNPGWKTLATKYGLQDGHAGSVVFVIKGDGKELFRSEVVKDDRAREQAVDVTGVKLLELVVEDGGDGSNNDWGVWLDPRLGR